MTTTCAARDAERTPLIQKNKGTSLESVALVVDESGGFDARAATKRVTGTAAVAGLVMMTVGVIGTIAALACDDHTMGRWSRRSPETGFFGANGIVPESEALTALMHPTSAAVCSPACASRQSIIYVKGGLASRAGISDRMAFFSDFVSVADMLCARLALDPPADLLSELHNNLRHITAKSWDEYFTMGTFDDGVQRTIPLGGWNASAQKYYKISQRDAKTRGTASSRRSRRGKRACPSSGRGTLELIGISRNLKT